MRSPASERVVGGIVETVLSDRLVDDFDEALRHRTEAVRDGQPLYLYLRSKRPLGELAHPADPYSPHSFSAYPHLFVQIGDNQSMRILSTCYVTLSKAEAQGHTLVIPLAPLTERLGGVPSDCWLETVTQAELVKQIFEVRLAGFPGRFEAWLPVPDLLGVEAVETDLSRGAGQYAGMLRTEPKKAPTLALRGGKVESKDEGAASTRENARQQAAAAEQERARKEAAEQRERARAAAEEAAAAREARMQAAQQQANANRSTASGAAAAGAAATAGAAAAVTGGAAATAGAAGAGSAAASQGFSAKQAAEAHRAEVESRAMAAKEEAARQAQAREEARKAQAEEAARLDAMPAGARLQPLTPLLPARPQTVGGPRMAQQLRSLTSTLLGREPSETYFVERQWQSVPGRRGQRDARQNIRAIAIFRGEECSWQSLMVSRRPGSSTLSDVALDGDEVPVPCPELDR